MGVEVSNIYDIDTQPRMPLGYISKDWNSGWTIQYVQFTAGWKFRHGDAVVKNAAFAVTPIISRNVSGVIIRKAGVDATSAAKYGWIAIKGDKPAWVNMAADTVGQSASCGASGDASGGFDVDGKPLIFTASAAAYPAMGKLIPTTRSTAYTTATTTTANVSAALNAELAITDMQALSPFKGVSAISAFTATGNEQSGYLQTTDKYYKFTAANDAMLSGTGATQAPISADIRVGDVVVYNGESRIVISASTASGGLTAILASGFGNTAAVTAGQVKVGNLKALADFY